MKNILFPAKGCGGGILFDLFLILITIGVGAYLWFSWDGKIPQKVVSLGNKEPAAKSPVNLSLNEKSAHIQTRIRELLLAQGVQDSWILKSYTEEREQRGTQWLESTIEIKKVPAFNADQFYKSLLEEVSKENYYIMRNQKEDQRWLLEIGDNQYVFQRIIVRPEGQFFNRLELP